MLNLKFGMVREDNYNYYIKEQCDWYDVNGTMIEHWYYENNEDLQYDSEINEVTDIIENLEKCIFRQLKKYLESIEGRENPLEKYVVRGENDISIEFETDLEGQYHYGPNEKTTLSITINNDLIEKSEWTKNFIKTIEKAAKDENYDVKSYCDKKVVEGIAIMNRNNSELIAIKR